MSNVLQSLARTAFAAIRTAHPETVVTVVSGAQTAQGIRDTERTGTMLTDVGEQGATTGTVRLDASEMNEPERGASITVDGDPALVTDTRFIPPRALLVIEYSKQRPLTGEGL